MALKNNNNSNSQLKSEKKKKAIKNVHDIQFLINHTACIHNKILPPTWQKKMFNSDKGYLKKIRSATLLNYKTSYIKKDLHT